MSKRFLVTGAAGFIGSHVAKRLVDRGDSVIGLDNLNDYYDPIHKQRNLSTIRQSADSGTRFEFILGDFRDRQLIERLFTKFHFHAIVHLGAMAGVRASIDDPALYFDVNLNGTLILLEAAVGRLGPKRSVMPSIVFATTSSVYGGTQQFPFVETDPCDRPMAPYAASKRASELLGFSYYHLYGLPFTGLRFFTVYGPRGRPDMMAFKILDNIFFDREVPLFNNGQMYRDWTYIDDIVTGVVAAADRPMGYEIINLGRGEPVLLADFVTIIETLTGRTAKLTAAPMPDVDIPYTFADIRKAQEMLGYVPSTGVKEGVTAMWQWYKAAFLENGSGNASGDGGW